MYCTNIVQLVVTIHSLSVSLDRSRSILWEWIANIRQIPTIHYRSSSLLVLGYFRAPFINMYRMWFVDWCPKWRILPKVPNNHVSTNARFWTCLACSTVILLLLIITTTAMQLQWHRIWLWTCINWVEPNLWMKFHDRVSLCFCGALLSCVKQIIFKCTVNCNNQYNIFTSTMLACSNQSITFQLFCVGGQRNSSRSWNVLVITWTDFLTSIATHRQKKCPPEIKSTPQSSVYTLLKWPTGVQLEARLVKESFNVSRRSFLFLSLSLSIFLPWQWDWGAEHNDSQHIQWTICKCPNDLSTIWS